MTNHTWLYNGSLFDGFGFVAERKAHHFTHPRPGGAGEQRGR